MPSSSIPEYRYHSGTVYRNWNGLAPCGGAASATCYGALPQAEVHRYSGTTGLEATRQGRLAKGRLLATCDEQGRYLSVGGPLEGAVPGQSWIGLFAVDPRTGETSIDPGSPSASDLALPWNSRDHSLPITSQGGDPSDVTLTAPRLRALLLDSAGTARTVFAAGESATLRITTETGSQPVVRGTVSGSLTQVFGTLPVEFPVTFTQAGSWHSDILGWTAKPTQGATSLAVVVTPAGLLGPSLPGKPKVLSRDPAPGDTGVEPSAIVKIAFTEPVRNAVAAAFSLAVNGGAVPFKVIANGREVTDATTLAQEVWLVPDQRLGLGATVAVGISSMIADQDAEALDAVAWSFTLRGADTVGTLAGVGTYSDLVLTRGTVYAVEQVGVSAGGSEFDIAGAPIQAIRMLDVSDPSRPVLGNAFGAHGPTPPQRPHGL